ncbi:ABC transporter permease subunit [Leadbettera azotonutricia]|uniref:ABC transporter permease subunit n=1 Tax=Leadbettera azotonutricia TaxID=150829 RepID=UPI00145F7427|nr:ABC transporter permease subunit [Leadbettera azotonutricia]
MDEIKSNWILYLFVFPAFLTVLFFSYGPMVFLITSFFDYNPIRGLMGSRFIGFANFARAINDKYFWQAFGNTVFIKTSETLITFPLSIILSLFLFEASRGYKKIVQTATILPYFISWIVVSAMFKNLLAPSGGLVNEILVSVFKIKPIAFLTTSSTFRWVIILQDAWKYGGYFAVIYHSAMIAIDTTLFEVATLDGAGRWRQMVSVTLPSIKPTLVTMFVLLTGYIVIGPFEQVFAQYHPIVYDTGDIVETYSYRLGLSQYKYGFAVAIGFIQSIIATTVVLIANFVLLKKTNERVF